MCKLYNVWKEAKDYFVKPKLRVYFGLWKNDPNLPVWRRGPFIRLTKTKAHTVKDSVLIHTHSVPFIWHGKTYHTKCYDWVPKHKLPGKLKPGDYVWNRDIRKKLKKWHLSRIPPIIYLPIWTRFHIININVIWKDKYDTPRYEYPPQFSIIAFGLSLTFTLHCPVNNEYTSDDSYWESILDYLYYNDYNKLEGAIDHCGICRRFLGEKKGINYFAVRPEYITDKHKEEYYAAISNIRKQKDEVIL